MSTAVDLSKYIELRDNRPHIRGRRLLIAFVAAAEQANKLSLGDLAYLFTLTEEQVLAALLYYYEHMAEIDTQDAADARQSLEMHQRYGKKPGQTCEFAELYGPGRDKGQVFWLT